MNPALTLIPWACVAIFGLVAGMGPIARRLARTMFLLAALSTLVTYLGKLPDTLQFPWAGAAYLADTAVFGFLWYDWLRLWPASPQGMRGQHEAVRHQQQNDSSAE